MQSWSKDTRMTICHHGVRSLDAAAYLRGHGFGNTKSVMGRSYVYLQPWRGAAGQYSRDSCRIVAAKLSSLQKIGKSAANATGWRCDFTDSLGTYGSREHRSPEECNIGSGNDVRLRVFYLAF